VIVDNSGDDSDPATGSIKFSGDFGSFTGTASNPDGVQVQAVTNAPATGETSGFITNTTVEVRNSSGSTKTLQVTTESTGFTDPVGNPLQVFTKLDQTRFAGTISSTLDSFLDNVAAGSVGPVAGSGSDSTTVLAARLGATYDLKNTLSITASPGSRASTTGNTIASAVPAPASLLMALTGTPLLGGYYWLRRRINLRRLAIA